LTPFVIFERQLEEEEYGQESSAQSTGYVKEKEQKPKRMWAKKICAAFSPSNQGGKKKKSQLALGVGSVPRFRETRAPRFQWVVPESQAPFPLNDT
jgi:hypothetical protein